MCRPFTNADTPTPGMLTNSSTLEVATTPRSRKPLTTARAMGCSLCISTAITADKYSGTISSTPCRVMIPVVRVPVLSNTIVSIPRVASRTWAPLMMMPSRAARLVPTNSATGVASPNAQGHAITSTETAA